MFDRKQELYVWSHFETFQMCSLRDTVHEYVDALKDTEKKIQACPAEVQISTVSY